MGFLFSKCSPAFIIGRLSDDSHSDLCEVVPHCGFDLHFTSNKWCWASFHVPVSHLSISSLKKCLFRSSALTIFTEQEQIILKFIWSFERPWIAKWNPQGKEQSWCHNTSRFQTILQNYSKNCSNLFKNFGKKTMFKTISDEQVSS